MQKFKTKIAINGFGRIGRTVLRRALEPDLQSLVEIVAINDIAPLETCAYLFQYDSVFGPYAGQVSIKKNLLIVDGMQIPFYHKPDISELDFSSVDVVMECTGSASSRTIAERGLAAGAGKVLISGPSSAADVTVVLGANEAELETHKIVSNASCTTNALAPLLNILDQNFGVLDGQMTTIHCYTGSQPTVDMPRGDLVRSRAAALSMVPTTTSATNLIDQVLPRLAGRIEGRAVRVPTASVSAIDLTLRTDQDVSVEGVNDAFEEAAKNSGVFGTINAPLVSSDLRARPESIVMSLPDTSVTNAGLLRVFGRYDNEWGFSSRMLDMAQRMTP